MKIKYLALVAGLFVIQIPAVKSQIPVLRTELIIDKIRLNEDINGHASTLYSNIDGDPYLFKDFKTGKLVLINGGQYDINLRFDIYANQIHLKDKDEVYAVIHPDKIKSIEVDTYKIIYSKFAKSTGEKSVNEGCYFILKVDGKCKLLTKKNIRLQNAEPEKPFQGPTLPKFIVKEDTYYLKLKDESAVRIKNNKDLQELLFDQKQALSIFIKSNKLDSNNAEDLNKIVSYYNSL